VAVFLGDYNIFGKREDMNVVRDKTGKYAAVIRKAEGDKCPIATQDVSVNLANREKAIETAAYGPLNPAEPNTDFWNAKAKRWELPIAEAKKSLCGNCAAFIKTPEMLGCIESGLGTQNPTGAMDTIKAGDLGYCEAFDFKCASARTCDAWISGGPVTKAKNFKVGDFVRWDSNASVAQGKIERIVTDGKINVPNSTFEVKGEPDNPAVLIRIYKKFADGWKATDTRVGHKASTLRSIQDLV
jgi:hypothetical protein